MIVRCTGCNSSFAVDDSKVTNKKFAFSCPKCSTENIIDNKLKTVTVTADKTGMETSAEFSGMGTGITGQRAAVDHKRIDASSEMVSGVAGDRKVLESDEFDISISDDHGLDDDIDIDNDIIFDVDDENNNRGQGRNEKKDESDDAGIDIDIDSMDFSDTGKAEMKDELDIDDDVDFDNIPDIDEFKPIEDEDIRISDAGFDDTAGLKAAGDESRDNDGTVSVNLDTFYDDYEEDKEKRIAINTKSTAVSGSVKEKPAQADEDVTLDLDSLDLDLIEDDTIKSGVEPDGDDPALAGMKTRKPLVMDEYDEEDEKITLDLDSLDLDLIEDDTIKSGVEPDGDDLALAGMKTRKPLVMDEYDEEDEKITLDLDSLDLDLIEDENMKEGETPDGLEFDDDEMDLSPGAQVKAGKDEDITLDMDSLDISLSETEENMEGESTEDDEKITLEDAGISFDDLTSDEIEQVTDMPLDIVDEDEDIRLTIDEIDPTFDLNDTGDGIEEDDQDELKIPKHLTAGIGGVDEKYPDLELDADKEISNLDIEFDKLEKEFTGRENEGIEKESSVFGYDRDEEKIKKARFKPDDMELLDIDIGSYDKDLPDLDLSDFEEEELKDSSGLTAGIVGAGVVGAAAGMGITKVSDDIMDIDDSDEYSGKETSGDKYISVKKGMINFSIDYTLGYSRLGALLRLLGLIFIAFIPHFIVLIIYSMLSLILGFFNHIIVMITKKPVEDFQTIQENTLRYFLSVYASIIGIVEEMPVFTGRDNIDHSLQLNITYGLRYSNLLAALRLSGIGIVIISLPHLVILALISVIIPLITIAGLASVLVTGKWPYFLFDFLTKYYRSLTRLMAFIMGLVDDYPPFKFG